MKGMDLAIRIALYAVLFLAAAAVVCSFIITSYKTYQPFASTPGDYGFAYTPFTVNGARGAVLSCWYIPATNARAVLVCSHGIADSKEGILPAVLPYVTAGFSVVVYDLRRHHESTGAHCTLGYWETEDLLAITDHVTSTLAPGMPVCYWGFSLGATVSLLAAARRDDITAVIAQSPFVTLRQGVGYYAWHFYRLPPWPVVPLGLAVTQWRTGMDPDAVDVRRAAARLRATHTLLVGAEEDRQVPLEWLKEIQAAIGARAQLVVGPYGHTEWTNGQDARASGATDGMNAEADPMQQAVSFLITALAEKR